MSVDFRGNTHYHVSRKYIRGDRLAICGQTDVHRQWRMRERAVRRSGRQCQSVGYAAASASNWNESGACYWHYTVDCA